MRPLVKMMLAGTSALTGRMDYLIGADEDLIVWSWRIAAHFRVIGRIWFSSKVKDLSKRD